MGVCQKNCAIDYTKCLVTTFDMATCTQQEGGCALDCLKSSEVKVAVSDACAKCMIMAAGNIQTAITAGCGASTDTVILANCQVNYTGPNLKKCTNNFISKCNIFNNQIVNNVFSAQMACKNVGLC